MIEIFKRKPTQPPLDPLKQRVKSEKFSSNNALGGTREAFTAIDIASVMGLAIIFIPISFCIYYCGADSQKDYGKYRQLRNMKKGN